MVGYALGKSAGDGALILSVQQRVPLEFYVTDESFSEIENTKTKLRALAIEFLTDVRTRHHISALGAEAARSGSGDPMYAVDPAAAVDELEKGVELFRTSDQETLLVQELLVLLKAQKLDARWLEVYLALVYDSPMNPLVGTMARPALEVSERLGRQKDLIEAFELVRRIPCEFSGKERVLAASDQLTLRTAGMAPGRTVACQALPEMAESASP